MYHPASQGAAKLKWMVHTEDCQKINLLGMYLQDEAKAFLSQWLPSHWARPPVRVFSQWEENGDTKSLGCTLEMPLNKRHVITAA